MPIISRVGRRNWKTRVVLIGIYALLGVGACSMIYPLLLMLSGSVKSDADHQSITTTPDFLWDDQILWTKYVEAKYGYINEAEKAYRRPLSNWQAIPVPDPATTDQQIVHDFRDFRAAGGWCSHWFTVGQVQSGAILAANTRRYQHLAEAKYGEIAAFNHDTGGQYGSWIQVPVPPTPYTVRRFTFRRSPDYLLLDQLKAESPLRDRVAVDLDGVFWNDFLRPQWASISSYNAAHGTRYTDYREVLLSRTPPPAGQARADWEQFVRNELNLAFIAVSPSLTDAFRQHLMKQYDGAIHQLNRRWQSAFTSFDQIAVPNGASCSLAQQSDLAGFVKDRRTCPLEGLSVFGLRQAFETFVAARRGVAIDQVTPIPLPTVSVDYIDFQSAKASTRWELFTRNYVYVIDFLLLNGNGLRNTVIYCALSIVAGLTINPLAAYALSRHKPPSTHKILLFCMCTMAFPGEVTMIPSFLLLKRFPLYAIATAVVCGVSVALIAAKVIPKWPAWSRGILAATLGLLSGFYVLPRVFGDAAAGVSLLNTYWALVVPAAANGFTIFLLKGFFDSLPQELYEAAEIDGAGEFTKFWTITMGLSKPILAVIALGVFVQTYSEFMMALVIIPDPHMWTIMVWLFQFQQTAHPTVVYASLVVAAIPTLAVFLACQKLIIQGIVVPVEK